MNDYIYSEYNMNDRIKMLQNMSVKSVVKTYNRSLSDSEIESETQKFASDAIEKNRQEKDLKAETERMKAGIKSVENLMEERLERIQTRQKETTATLYGLPDHNKGVMNWYDNYGERIQTTPLTPDEKQGKLFIGDDPLGKSRTDMDFSGQVTPGAGEGIQEIDFEDANEIQGTEEETLGDPSYDQAVDAMYAENGGSVDIPVENPNESKPKKKANSKKGGDDNAPL